MQTYKIQLKIITQNQLLSYHTDARNRTNNLCKPIGNIKKLQLNKVDTV
jgi:hypothetical protein